MCQYHTTWSDYGTYFSELPEVLERLYEMEHDGLVQITENAITVTDKGKAFVRNICMAFDLRLNRNKPETELFSMTV
jgi:oxygen-independent coproporphyrinogen-3 oxidase